MLVGAIPGANIDLGGAPTPKLANIRLQGTTTTWFSPQTTLTLPPYILNNSTVTCPGTITFKANKANLIPADKGFSVYDELSVEARLSKIERCLPEFRLLTNID